MTSREQQSTARDGAIGSPTVMDLVRAIETDIVLGRVFPRERLIEQSLIERFGVSRSVVRAALSELERLNLVVRRPSAGVTVIDLSPEEVLNLYNARLAVQVAAIHAIPFPVERSLIQRLREIQEKHSQAVRQGNFETVFRKNIVFHRTLFSACGNPYLEQIIEDLSSKSNAVRSYSHTDSKLLDAAQHCHWQMISALESSDRDWLERLCREHITPSRDAYIRAYKRRFGEQQ